MNDRPKRLGDDSTIPLLSALLLALAFLGIVVAIGLTDGPDAPAAASSTTTTAAGGPQGDILTPLVTLRLDTAGEGKGTVRVAGMPKVCGQACSFKVDQDTSVTIIARSAPGSRFVSWTGSCGGGRICTILMDKSQTITALFSLPSDSTPEPVAPEPDCTDGLDNDDDGYADDADVECFTGNSEAPLDDPGATFDDVAPPPVARPPVVPRPVVPPPVVPPPPPPVVPEPEVSPPVPPPAPAVLPP